jgi:hypothetical protein
MTDADKARELADRLLPDNDTLFGPHCETAEADRQQLINVDAALILAELQAVRERTIEECVAELKINYGDYSKPLSALKERK